MSNRNKQPPPPQPAQRKPILLNATVTFDTPKGAITFQWNAENGDCTHNGEMVHNTNDLAVLHTIAKGMLAAKGSQS